MITIWFLLFYEFTYLKQWIDPRINCPLSYQSEPNKLNLIGNYTFEFNISTNAYEVNSKPIIWLYWNEKNLPDYVKILIESIICVNPTFEVILIDNETVGVYWPEYPKAVFASLIPAHQSDLVRVHVLKKFGGVYLDVDTFAISSLAPFYDLLINHHLVGSNWTPMNTDLSVGHLGPSRANISLFRLWAEWQDLVIENKAPRIQTPNSYPIQWPELLADISMPIIKHFNGHKMLRYFQLDGVNTVGQLVRDGLSNDVLQSLNSTYSKLKQLKTTPLLYFHNSAQHSNIKFLSMSQLLNATNETIFGLFTKCALRKCYQNYTTDERLETNATGINVRFLIQIVEEKQRSTRYPCVL